MPRNRRERVLTDDELRAVWKAADEMFDPFRGILKLLLLTGARRGEIAALRREWISIQSSEFFASYSPSHFAFPDSTACLKSTSTTEQCALGAGSETQKGLLLSAPYKAQNDDGNRPSVSSSQSAENTDCAVRGEASVKALEISDAEGGKTPTTSSNGLPSQCTIPKEITKNKRAHTFPIGPTASILLCEIISNQASGSLLFPARGATKAPFQGWSKAKAALDKKIIELTQVNLIPWVLHDIRRYYASTMQRLGVRTEVIERLLNHVSGTRAGIVSVYQRYEFWPEMVEAVERYERHIKSVVELEH